MDNIEFRRERLKDVVEKQAREEVEETTEQQEEQTEDKMDLTVTENERVLKEVCGSFVVLQTPTVDINGYFD